MKKYIPFNCRIFYLTGEHIRYLYFGEFSILLLARIVSKIMAIIRDIATYGENDGIYYGVMEKTGRNKNCAICRSILKITGRERKAETRTLCKECRKIVKKLIIKCEVLKNEQDQK